MTDASTLAGVGILLLVLILFVIFSKRILEWWNQKQTDRKRKRAHAGKVQCEETTEPCDRAATTITHNGYFCEIHWEPNSKYHVNGGWVTWHHQLAHTMKPA